MIIVLNLNGLEINTRVFIAPMAGVTDYPYRQILREFGAGVLFTEMISSQGLIQGNRRTENLIEINHEKPGIIGVQIFGEDPSIMAEAAALVAEKHRPDLLDINMGCPARKVVSTGAGAALMQDPKQAGQITRAVARAVELPVTVKIRLGWDSSNLTAARVVDRTLEAGAAAVTVHGRTREQFYSGRADWQAIAKIASSTSALIIGNGDIFTAEDTRKMLETTGCQAVMLARGIQGNPWLVKTSRSLVDEGRKIPGPTVEKRISRALDHLQRAIDYYGQDRAVPLMRKHLSWYIKSLPHAARVRDRINKLTEPARVQDLLLNYQQALTENREQHFKQYLLEMKSQQ